MTEPSAYKDALSGVTGILHTASPFVLLPKDNKTELLDPAIKGATSIFKAAKEWGKDVKRIVLTSSFAANLDMSKGYRPGYTYTEKDWNPITYDEAAVVTDGPTAYCGSKKLAEEAAWKWVEENKPSFTLSTIAPAWVFGPNVSGIKDLKHLNESTHALWSLVGAEKVPPTDFAGCADVRDVAKAHLLALEKDEAQGERFIIGHHFDWQTAADEILAELPELKGRVPEGVKGAGKTEEVYVIDGSKAEKVLGFKYMPLGVTLKDSLVQLLEAEKRE
jgi:NADPH-dependent methylglyoxal reductase